MQGNTHLHSRYRPQNVSIHLFVAGANDFSEMEVNAADELQISHHCLDGEVYCGNRHYNVCEHVGLDTNQSLHHPPERDVLG